MAFTAKIHPGFKFNGLSYTEKDLEELAYDLVKEGEAHEQSAGDFLLDWLNTEDWVEVKTSGTTGAPKNIRILKNNMLNSAMATGRFFDLGPGNSALHCLPSKYIAGKMMWVRAMILGWEIDLVAPSSKPLENTDKKYDFCAMVPLQVQNSLEELHRVKKLIIGGAKVSEELTAHLQHVPTLAYETYGMTETITHIAAKKLNHLKDPSKSGNFHLLPNVSIEKDERDCLLIEAPEVASEKIITNDIVEIVSDLEFKWLGRFDNVINSGGIKLIPEQIEIKLSKTVTNRFFLSSIKDKQLGEKLILVVEGSEKERDRISEAIKSLKTIDKYEIPREIYFFERFEETENGKIVRKLG
ncbi:AMP-binding protein [Leptobacterium flavescens]|uniref:AMP-binding protein n=1 Tax=Leptobacterium flavescens TaxID=472055 RepID=A0A6P0UKR3_9FLAO|nr:AMP-binding protein [Leptobacterium flavescens]NER13875.1 AMP-binding protein [Leptobacterium flavescens]